MIRAEKPLAWALSVRDLIVVDAGSLDVTGIPNLLSDRCINSGKQFPDIRW